MELVLLRLVEGQAPAPGALGLGQTLLEGSKGLPLGHYGPPGGEPSRVRAEPSVRVALPAHARSVTPPALDKTSHSPRSTGKS